MYGWTSANAGCETNGVTVIKGIKADRSKTTCGLLRIFCRGTRMKTQYENDGGWMSFLSVLEAVGKGFEKGLKWAVTYAVPVEKLIGLLFPAAAPVANEVADATSLIQTAVLLVEQKYAASGVQSGTGAQKLAEVMLLTESAVTGLLTKAGLSVDSTYVANVVSAVVAILNVQQALTPAAA
jgi:hypothetical protein